MRTVEVSGTGIVTTAIGLGCASLYHLPRPSQRRALIEEAYDSGIRHFDVAPMYGLGLAEAELASVTGRNRSEVTIATKFGIEPSSLGRLSGRIQPPLRALLSRLPKINHRIKRSARHEDASLVNKLYRYHSFTVQYAQASLERSLKVLQTDYVDIFLLHEPRLRLVPNSRELIEYLNDQVSKGKFALGAWRLTYATNPGHSEKWRKNLKSYSVGKTFSVAHRMVYFRAK